MAVSLEPAAVDPGPEPEPDPDPEPILEPEPRPALPGPTTTPAPAPTRARAEPPEVELARPTAVALGIAPQLEVGALPGVSGGPRLSLGVEWARAEAALYGFYGAPRRTDTVDGVSGLALMGAAGARGCVVFGAAVRVPLCALAEAGRTRVASRGLSPPNLLRYWWGAAGARVGVSRRWGRVGVFGAAEAVVPFSRPAALVGDTAVFTAWSVCARAIVGLQIFFATDSA